MRRYSCPVCSEKLPREQVVFVDMDCVYPIACKKCVESHVHQRIPGDLGDRIDALLVLNHIIKQFAAFKVKEVHSVSDHYCGIVIERTTFDTWTAFLEETFGPATKPVGVMPTEFHEYLTHRFGGLKKHQMLYYREFNGFVLCAVIWPWTDREFLSMRFFLVEDRRRSHARK